MDNKYIRLLPFAEALLDHKKKSNAAVAQNFLINMSSLNSRSRQEKNVQRHVLATRRRQFPLVFSGPFRIRRIFRNA